MTWWNDLIDWMSSPENRELVIETAAPFIAVLLAALIGAGVGRQATKRLVEQRDRESRANAVAALVTAGTHAASWASQSATAKEHSEQLANSADIAVRLMPVKGASLAADWARHEITDLRTNSVSFSFASDQALREFRDRLLEWVDHPRRAKKLFAADLERWAVDATPADPLYMDQVKWMEQQASAAAPVAPTTPLTPAATSAPTAPTPPSASSTSPTASTSATGSSPATPQAAATAVSATPLIPAGQQSPARSDTEA